MTELFTAPEFLMTIQIYLTYLLACIAITIIPGPTVTLIIANSLSHGTRAGLLNVAGTQLGLAMMLGVLLVGLSSIIATMGWWFDWVRIAGAVYLVWIGWKLLRSSGALGELDKTPKPRGGFFLQGFLVLMSNPKALLWFGAFIPQFVDPSGNYVGQIVVCGLTAMVTAAVTDGAYAILGGRTGKIMSRQRIRLASRLSGLFLIGGGVWLAFTRAR
jgi:threonine/homoserine/homoserine lactone efflux protein